MADIATIWDAAGNRGDWALPPSGFAVVPDAGGRPIVGTGGVVVTMSPAGGAPGAGLESGDDIATAVLISLFTDAAATEDDQLPDGTADPRGWWGDPTIGSRLWLRARGKQTPATLLLVKSDIEAALEWLITDDIAAAIDVTTQWSARGFLAATVTVRRRDGTHVAVAFEWAWKDL